MAFCPEIWGLIISLASIQPGEERKFSSSQGHLALEAKENAEKGKQFRERGKKGFLITYKRKRHESFVPRVLAPLPATFENLPRQRFGVC